MVLSRGTLLLILRALFSHSLRRLIFICSCLLIVGLVHIWQNEEKLLHNRTNWQRIRSELQASENQRSYNVQKGWHLSIPPAFKKFTPQTLPNNTDYVMIPKADFMGFGDYKSFRTAQQDLLIALKECDRMSEFCKAFSANLNSPQPVCHVKNDIGIPQESSTNLYIKKVYLDNYIKVLRYDLSCVNPNKTASHDDRCKLPVLNPWAQDIVQLVPTLPPKKCNDDELYTELTDNVLRLRHDKRNDPNFLYAIAEPVIRGNHDGKWSFGPPRHLAYTNDINNSNNININDYRNNSDRFTIDTDLWKVTAHLKNDVTFRTFHLSVVEKPEVLTRMPTTSSDTPLDIYILVFDGTSEAHFRRMLPKSYAFIKNELNAFMFKGYSVVGDATLPNMNAMLTGIPLVTNVNIKNLNDWPLIFKDLMDKGFVTMHSEDMPVNGAFTLTLPGFDEPPTDHYSRPLWESGAVGQCLGGQFQVKLQLDYLMSYVKSYHGRRKFSYTHLTDLCHRQLNLLSTADVELLEFFKHLKNGNLLDKSMFVIMGDHGARFGTIRGTYQGKLEERLPMLAITLPSWFQETYKEKVASFQRNTEVILSPFDLHATFEHLMEFSKPFNRTKIGTSLFEDIPEDRQCSDTGISDSWCPCLEWISIDHTHEQINASADRIVSWMNQNLAANTLSKSLCSPITLKRILNAVQNIPKHSKNINTKTNRCSYQIQLETKPGDALFEVTIDLLNDGSYVIYDVSRINAYGNQAQCIESKVPSVRKYCYCI